MSAQTNRVAGHTLVSEGRPRLVADCCGTADTDGWPNHYDRRGHGRCSCGAVGPCQTTDLARRQWHRDHKNQVRTDTYFASTVPDHLPDNDESRGHGSVR